VVIYRAVFGVPVGQERAEGVLAAAVGCEDAQGVADDAGTSAVFGGEHVEDGVIFVVESDCRGAHVHSVARACCGGVAMERAATGAYSGNPHYSRQVFSLVG